MKNTLLLLSLAGIIAFSAACDRGNKFDIPDDVAIFVRVEREFSGVGDAVFKVFANDFNLNRDVENNVLLMFTCPCYLGWHKWDMFSPVVKINDQQIMSMKLLSGAVYNVSEKLLKSGEERSYYFPLIK